MSFEVRVTTTVEEWKSKHAPHLNGVPFTTKPFAEGHPDWPHQDWQFLVCPCGAMLLANEPDEVKVTP